MENLAFGSSIATLSATDPDLDSRLVFQRIAITIYGPDERLLLVNSSIAEAMTSDFNFILRWFNLNPETGEIAVSANVCRFLLRDFFYSMFCLNYKKFDLKD